MKTKFDEEGFCRRLQQIVNDQAQGVPGRFAAMVRKWHPTLEDGSLHAYMKGRIPGLNIAWAIAQAAKVSLDELVGGPPFALDRYKRALWVLFRQTVDSQIVDFSSFKNEAVLDEFVDSVLAMEKKKPKK